MTRVDDFSDHVRGLGLGLCFFALAGCGSSGPATSSSTGGASTSNVPSTAQGGTSQATSESRHDTLTGGTNATGTGGTSTLAAATTGGSSGTGNGNTGGRTVATGGVATGGVAQTVAGGKSATGGTRSTGGAGTVALGGTSNSTSSGGTQGSGGMGSGGVSKGGASSSNAGGESAIGGKTSNGGATGAGGNTASTTGTTPTDAVIVPDKSWACGMPSGIPSPTRGTLVFQATLDLSATHDVGVTQYGHRRQLDIKGGKFTGDKVSGSFLAGGLDYELTLSNGVVELEEINVLKASDGTVIYVRSCGVAPAGESVIRFVPDFEVSTTSSLAWLNTGKFVGTRVVDAASNKLQLNVYDVSSVTATTPSVQITKPTGGTNQPWDCSTVTGGRGRSVFTESVKLGDTLNTGTAKRGTRNIIMITGGTTTGDVKGNILNGGADYQLASGGSTKLEARYTLAPSDGEFIIVRNCGPMGALIPQFETRADGPYKALNTPNGYVSSDPGGGTSGGVSITFYERQ